MKGFVERQGGWVSWGTLFLGSFFPGKLVSVNICWAYVAALGRQNVLTFEALRPFAPPPPALLVALK